MKSIKSGPNYVFAALTIAGLHTASFGAGASQTVTLASGVAPPGEATSFLSSNKLDAVSDTIAMNVATVDQTQGSERLMLFMNAVPAKGYVSTPVVSLVDFIRGKRSD